MNAIQDALHNLATSDLKTGAESLFAALGYTSEKIEELSSPNATGFAEAFGHQFTKAALESEWKRVELLFQLTQDELSGQGLLLGDGFNSQRFESFLFFAIDLKGDSYSRSALAGIARELNKPFPMPVIVLMRYDNAPQSTPGAPQSTPGKTVTLAAVHRRASKTQAHKDVLERVTLLKDIRLDNPHRAHLEILRDLGAAKSGVSTWAEFLARWNTVLDISELNKRFYRELSNWFFAAREWVEFPDKSENAKERGLIRLITRLIFTWFIKERGLVPEALFDEKQITSLLNDSKPDSNTYYRAILQNLFFATLNTEMGERRFRKATGGQYGQSGDYNLSCYFRHEKEFKSPQQWLDLVKDVPFLNGGLFECLDPEDKDGPRLDGFSDNPTKQASIRNDLFWGKKWIADLSSVYDDKRKQAVEVTPLLNLLHSYKFTIDENTPLEEDVALDPELLGKVFENLLASYNPETRTTARKQTGSFYTPREIVNYMVEEALAAYLEPTAGGIKTSDGDDAVRVLLSDTDARSASDLGFSTNQVEAIVGALHRCTILDPACGSGAFPMGALAKMVLLLKKLDPKNEVWLNTQLKAVDTALELTGAEKSVIEDAKARVREAFQNNDEDYARKLYLIERCLFGVDIQPIALQIAKLRCFIALVIDQNIKDDKPNRNIRALPNLETKFVAANTLVSLPKMGAITPHELPPLEAELAKVRRKHIAPKSRAEKKRLEKEDERLRSEIKSLMQEAGFGDSFITPIVKWNPYDQNAVAPFFDPERMFGPDLKAGFDIVIGNPPYVFARDSAAKGITADDKKYYIANYKLAQYQVNLYALFIEKSGNLLKNCGVLSFITPNNWLTINTNKVLREYILQQSNIKIVNFLKQVFESADVDAAVMLFNKGCDGQDTGVTLYEWTDGLQEITSTTASFFQSINDSVINIEALKGNDTHVIMAKMEAASNPLREMANVKCGLGAYGRGDGIPPQTDEMIRNRVYHARKKVGADYFKYLEGSDVSRYHLGWSGEYLKHGKHLREPRNDWRLFSSPRILVRQIPNKPPYCIHACFTEETLLNDRNSMNVINIQVSPLFVLGVLNSKPTSWWFVHKFGKMQRGTFPQFKVNELATFPIPKATPTEQKNIAAKVEKILIAKAANSSADTSQLEQEIDELVADLYGLDADEKKLVGVG